MIRPKCRNGHPLSELLADALGNTRVYGSDKQAARHWRSHSDRNLLEVRTPPIIEAYRLFAKYFKKRSRGGAERPAHRFDDD